MAVIKTMDNIKHCEDVEQLECSYTAGGSGTWNHHLENGVSPELQDLA